MPRLKNNIIKDIKSVLYSYLIASNKVQEDLSIADMQMLLHGNRCSVSRRDLKYFVDYLGIQKKHEPTVVINDKVNNYRVIYTVFIDDVWSKKDRKFWLESLKKSTSPIKDIFSFLQT